MRGPRLPHCCYTMSGSKYSKYIKILSAFGIGLALYLFINYLTQPIVRICTINSRVNCDAVISGEVSTTLGIPTSLYGLIGYVAILVFSILNKKKWVFGVSLFGTLFCLRITFIEVFMLKVYCPVCALCQLDMLALLILSFYDMRQKKPVITS